MYDLQTITNMNTFNAAPHTYRAARIYDIGGGKYALGFKGSRALWVVRKTTERIDSLGRKYPRYIGVQARKPIIPHAATPITRDEAGRLLKSALGIN